MSILTIFNAKFKRFTYKNNKESKAFAIFTCSLSQDMIGGIVELIKTDPKLSTYYNKNPYILNKNNVSFKTNNVEFATSSIPEKTSFDFEISKIEYNAQYDSFTLVMDSFEELIGSPQERMKNFLVNYIDGIGEVKAENIVETFDVENLDDIFTNKPTELLKINGIREMDLPAIQTAWKDNVYRFTMADKCSTLRLPKAVINRAVEQFGHKAYDKLLNPYPLLYYKQNGIKPVYILGWDDVELMRLPKDIQIDEDERIKAALILAYRNLASNSGSTLVEMTSVIKEAKDKFLDKYASKKTDLSKLVQTLLSHTVDGDIFGKDNETNDNTLFYKLIGNDIALLLKNKGLSEEQYTIHNNKFYLSSTDDRKLEKFIVDKLKEFLIIDADSRKFKTSDIEKFKAQKTTLDETQAAAVLLSMNHRVLYVTGGPGTGKTYTINYIRQVFEQSGKTCLFCAPTGKAAQRITENTGKEAATIHRLFKITPDNVEDEGIEAVFTTFNGDTVDSEEDEIIDADVLIVDESSMLSLTLMAKMFTKINPKRTVIIFVGDKDQLPPIERGCFFRDIVSTSIVPGARLEVLHRISEESKVAQIAACIRNRLPCDITTTPNFEFTPAKTDLDIQKIIKEKVKTLLAQGVSVMDIQILTPQDPGIVGVSELNDVLRPIFNPNYNPNLKNSKNMFFVDDKVMQTINNKEKNVFNGVVGQIKENTEDGTVVRFGEKENAGNTQVVVYKDNKELAELTLAYNITIHKSQGSDYPHVIIVLSPTHNRMWTQSLLYTGVTRTKHKLHVVGESRYLTDPSYLPQDKPRLTNTQFFLTNLTPEDLQANYQTAN